MTNRGMFIRVLAKSLTNRKTKMAAAVFAVLLGVSLIAALAAISLDARGKVGRELRAYGANILLSAKASEAPLNTGGLAPGTLSQSDYLPESDLDALRSGELAPYVHGYAPYLYGVIEVNQQKVVLAGTLFDQVARVSPWWQVTGKWIGEGEENAAIVGASVAEKLEIENGTNLAIRHGDRQGTFTVVGIVETGAAEDSQIFVNLSAAQKLLGKPGLVSTVQVSALTDRQPLLATSESVKKRMPGANVNVLSQFADAEASVVSRVEILLLVVSVLVLLAAALTVASTMMTAVLERTKEIGLMKALGAGDARIASLFLAEAAAIGGIGGVLGFGVGAGVATFVGQSVFGAAISISPIVFPLSLAVALGICLLASALPVKRAIAVDPAVTLRGE